eukprot:189249_1
MAMINLGEETPIKVLKSVFNSFDADKNGTLDKEEFNQLLSSVGIYDEYAQEAIQLLADKNADGVVDRNEFYEWIKKDKINEILQDSAKFKLLVGVSIIFKDCDVDGDKTLSWPEFETYMREDGTKTEIAKGFWKEIDTDGDGTITFKEFWDHNKNWNGTFDEYEYYDEEVDDDQKAVPQPPQPPIKQQEKPQKKYDVKSIDEAKAIKGADKEKYLSDQDFVSVFGMAKDAFYKQPVWKQKQQKQKKGFW